MNPKNLLREGLTQSPDGANGDSSGIDPMTVGATFATQVVSQAASSTVADASQYLRGVSSVSQAALGVLTAQLIALLQEPSPDKTTVDELNEAIKKCNEQLQTTSTTFKQIGTDAAYVLGQFKELQAS